MGIELSLPVLGNFHNPKDFIFFYVVMSLLLLCPSLRNMYLNDTSEVKGVSLFTVNIFKRNSPPQLVNVHDGTRKLSSPSS